MFDQGRAKYLEGWFHWSVSPPRIRFSTIQRKHRPHLHPHLRFNHNIYWIERCYVLRMNSCTWSAILNSYIRKQRVLACTFTVSSMTSTVQTSPFEVELDGRIAKPLSDDLTKPSTATKRFEDSKEYRRRCPTLCIQQRYCRWF